MRRHRWATTGVALGLLFTTAATTTYAAPADQQSGNNNNVSAWCKGPFAFFTPWLCDPTPRGPVGHDPVPSATPELDSLLLFGAGLTGLGGFAVTRYRARRRAG